MSASAQVTPVQVLPDEPDALMEYVAARTGETVCRRLERADVVVTGAITSVEIATIEGAAPMRVQLGAARRGAGWPARRRVTS